MRIVAKNLTHIYNEGSPFASHALNGVNLVIEEGEFFGIIGHTGSGKSTFVQHLNALIKIPIAEKKYKKKKNDPYKNTVLKVGDYDLTDKKTNFRELRSKVGMVFQYPEYQLFADTVYDDVAFGLKNFSKEKTKEEIDTAVQEAVEIVGLNYNEIKDKSPFDLSGGQKRRVAIAGVIVTKPEILVLDEPAAGLDPVGKKDIMELLHKLHSTWCKTVVFVSHDMDEVSENCTRLAVFADGEVKFVAEPKELFKNDKQLIELGLDIPLTAKITTLLKEKDINICSDYTKDDFIEKTLNYYNSHKGGINK